MRSKAAHVYKARSASNTTFASNTECVGVTGDFEGGFIQVHSYVACSIAQGAWFTATFYVDGVAMTMSQGVYQYGANFSYTMSDILRVPSGRHRIGIQFAASNPPAAGSCNASISVAEI